MKFKRTLSLLLCLCMISSFFTVGYAIENTELIDDEDYEIELFTQDRSSYFNKNYTLTGNPAKDIVIVAKAQLGVDLESAYTEAWCADFVTDCARLTGMSDTIIPYNYSSRGACRYLISKMKNDCNAVQVTTPQEGDFVFYYCATCTNHYPHVGIVMDSTYSIEGNSSNAVSKVKLSSTFKDINGHVCTREYIRPNYGNAKQILATPSINLNGQSIGTLEKNAENKVRCKVGDTVTFGWSGINNASTYQYAVARLPVGHTPNPSDDYESTKGVILEKGSGKNALSIPLTEAGVYKFAVGAIGDGKTYLDGDWAKVYLKVDASGNVNTSAPTNVKAKLSSSYVEEGEAFTFSMSADNATSFYAKFFKENGTAVWPKYEKISGTEILSVPTAGKYYFESYAENDYGKTNANKVYLTVTEKDSDTGVTPTPPSSDEGVLTIKATESSLAPYPCQYTDINGKLVSGNLQRIWPTTYSCDSSVLSWEAWPGTVCYQIAVRDLASNELVYEAYEYYDTKLEIGKLFRVDAPVRVWVAARDYQKKILAQGTATYYMHKPTMEWTNPNQKEYYLINEKIPVNIVATGLNKVIAYYKRSNATEWTKFGEVTSSAGMFNNINQDIYLDTAGMRKGTYRIRLEGYINDDMTPMTHTLDEFVLRTYPPEKTIKKVYLKFKDGTTMAQNGDTRDLIYTNTPINFNVIAIFEDGKEADITNENLTFDCDDGIVITKNENDYSANITKSGTYAFDIIHDDRDFGSYNFSANTFKRLELSIDYSTVNLRVGSLLEFDVIAVTEDKFGKKYEYNIAENTIDFNSENSAIATAKATNDKCIITGCGEGQTTITLKYKTFTKKLTVNVYPKVNTSNLVSVSCETGNSMTVFKGSEKYFNVYANYSDGSKEVISGISGLSISVRNTSVAEAIAGSVGNANIITGLENGTTYLDLTYGGKTCKVTVTVKDPTTRDIKDIYLRQDNEQAIITTNDTIYLSGLDAYIDYYIKIRYKDDSMGYLSYKYSNKDSNKCVIITANNSNVDICPFDDGVCLYPDVNSGTTIVTLEYKGITQKYNVKIGGTAPTLTPVYSTTELLEIRDTKAKFRTTINDTGNSTMFDYYASLSMRENGESAGSCRPKINTVFTPSQTVYEYWVEGLKPATSYRYSTTIYGKYEAEGSGTIRFMTTSDKNTYFTNLEVSEYDMEIPVGTTKNIEIYAVYGNNIKKNISGECETAILQNQTSYLSKKAYTEYITLTAKKECSKVLEVKYNGVVKQINVKVTNPKLTSITTQDATKTDSSITLNGTYKGAISAPSEYGFIYLIGDEEKTVNLGNGTTGDKTFSKTISGLKDNTSYTYRSYTIIDGSYYYGEVKTVKTDKGISLPNSEIYEAENVDITSVSLKGNIVSNGDGTISSYGFYYGTTDATSMKKVVGSNNVTGVYSANLSGLQPNTKYYVKSFVVNQAGEYISNYTTFKTLPKEPEVLAISTNLSDSISLEVEEAKKIYLYASLDNNSTVAVPMNSTDFSFISDNSNVATIVTEGTNGIINGVGKGSCKITLTYKGFSKTVNVTVTDKTSLPVVVTKDASGVLATSAILNGSISDNGNLDIIETGFYYYPKNNAGNKYQVICDTTNTSFNYEVKGLLEKTDYYFYAYAVNEKGTSIGEKILFTTKDGNNLPNDIKLNARFISLEIYNSQSILATVLPENATNKDVVWKSQDENIATVSQSGVVTGVKVGKTKIFAITVANRIVASCDVEVTYPKASDEFDFSEIHMAASMSELSKTGWDLPVSAGGNITMATAYLSRWDGAVLEDDAPYPSSYDYVRLDNANASKHVQNVYYLPPRQSATDNNDIKAAVMNYGAVSSSFRYAGEYFADDYSNYYVPESVITPTGGHAVAIVGWDDNYSKENFKYTPAGDGAFLCKNSWGATTAEEGYFWISYYDATFAKGQEQVAVFIGAEDTDNYNKIYQYDPLGCVTTVSNNSNTVMIANAFMGGHNDEVLKAVSFYTFEKGVNYEVYAVKDFFNKDSLVRIGEPLASGRLDYAGYHTIDLEKSINISANKKFAVIVKLTSKGKSVVALEKPIDYASNARANKNESFMKFGNSWVDIVTMHPNSNICLKAFTDVTGTSQGILLMGVDNENRTYYSEMTEPVEGVELIDVTPQAYKDFFENLESDDEISLFSTDSSEDYGVIPLPFLSGDNGVDVSEGVILPVEYDLRTFNRVSSVKDQGPLGTCWTFSTYASLESCLKGKTDSVITANGMIFSNSGLIAPETVEINVEEITIAYNGEAYLSADVLPSAADKSVIWSSSDEEVVTVSSNGRINGVSEGVALVFATSKDGSVMDFCTVEVTAPADLESINLSEDNIRINTGDIHLIDYVLYPTNVANQKIVWSTDNSSVASVSEYGVLTGVNNGVAVITASSEDGSCVAKVNVTVGEGVNNENLLPFTIANTIADDNVLIVVNNNSDNKQTGVLFTAMYNKQGRLVDLYDENISLEGLSNTSYSYFVDEGVKVKSFVWESQNSLKPLSDITEALVGERYDILITEVLTNVNDKTISATVENTGNNDHYGITAFVAVYDNGRLLEVKNEDIASLEVGETKNISATFTTNNIYEYKIFVWKIADNLTPLSLVKE